MNDDKILEKIKKSAETVEVPSNLESEKILDKLEHTVPPRKIYSIYKIASLTAAAFVLIVGGWGVMQARYGNVAETTDSLSLEENLKTVEASESYEELYDALEKLDRATNTGNHFSVDETVTFESSSETASVADSSPKSTETDRHSSTNTQTAGVDEGDIVKTDGIYIYSLIDEQIRIVDSRDMTFVAKITPDTYDMPIVDIYLDGNKLLVIASGTDSTLTSSAEDTYQVASQDITTLSTYDITDPCGPVLSGKIEQSGAYDSSRKNGDFIYLFTNYYTEIPTIKTSYENYIPAVDGRLLPTEDIYIPELYQNRYQLVISSVNVNTPDTVVDQKSILSGTDLYYVSGEHIYIANSQWKNNSNITQLISFAYDRGVIIPQAAGSVPGYLNDNFSLDEYNGYLRIVTTNEATDGTDLNGLYVLDNTLNVVGNVDNLAPNETIQSARFMGDTGYFVTYRQMDPLFSVDLSDPTNPQILGELKITGFSEYLHFYEENLLLGIGWESDPETGNIQGLKLSMFDISDPSNVVEKHKMVIEDVYSCVGIDNYKAVLIDPKKNLFGFAYQGNNNYNDEPFSNYGLFSYDPTEGFTSTFTYDLDNEYEKYISPYNARGLYIDDTFYLSTEKSLRSFTISAGYKESGQLDW